MLLDQTPNRPHQHPSRKPPSFLFTLCPPVSRAMRLMDYKEKGEGLDLFKDDVLRVFKRYNHWSYEDGGDRGWVPSWYMYIGKMTSSSETPGMQQRRVLTTLLSTLMHDAWHVSQQLFKGARTTGRR
ncbi:hypothetical protein DFH94DRAFT_496766 [Russula ochroleuca]|uniref:Uncharacterized protein n=1 Tax=Russula ochroleuca TaxID=152965 RepID=A0A9P5T9A5_9AGAM|nr:hypothetical protein DFH94DRAFT_496766 [Russula ochroleuca]